MLVLETTQANIMSMAALYGFLEPSREYLQELAGRLQETKPTPFRKNSSMVRRWLRRQRVTSLIDANKHTVKARDYLGNSKLRLALEALILADANRDAIPNYCKAICGVRPHPKEVSFFEHYFWNVGLLSPQEWTEYLSDHHDGDLLNEARKRGPQYALWKLGYREEVLQEDIVKAVLHEATMRFFETGSRKNGKDTAVTAKLWSEQIFRSLEELGKSGDAVQEVLNQLKNITIRLDRTDIASIEALKDNQSED
tara:strand:+ start:184 stop:945 length:762 start_codon:yes stop_codon:yes gene_type:complete